MLVEKKICFLGAGSIAESMISGMLDKKLVNPAQIYVTNRCDDERLQFLHDQYRVQTHREKRMIVPSCDLIILAMKPKDVDLALKEIGDLLSPQQLVISVLAGISTAYMEQHLQQPVPVVRAMPNTSSKVGLSATALAYGRHATKEHMNIAGTLFEAIGSVCTVEEEQLDAVTGLSGSGPAYVYYLVEAMEKAGREVGLEPEIARQLTLQTLIGAAHMLQSTQEEPEILRQQVTSPGGTTMAAIETLQSLGFQEAIEAAIRSATERSKELGASLVNK